MDARRSLTVVVAAHNEEEALPLLHPRIAAEAAGATDMAERLAATIKGG